MAAPILYPEDERLAGKPRAVFNLYMISAIALFVLMMILGLIMRMAQAGWMELSADRFYRLLSMHGAGMVGTIVLATTAVMWFFLRKYVRLSLWAFVTNYVLFMLGAVCIILAIFGGGYAALWTFLYPLPVQSMGLWSPNAAALFMLGYLLIGVGELIFYFDAARAIIQVHGNFARSLGLQWLFGGTIDQNHPKTVVASTSMIIVNSLGIIAGAVVLVMSLINIFYPQVSLDALFVKTLIYWFGHIFINASIYMGVIAIYELVPRYASKPYPLSRAFIWAWALTTILVIIVFPHHLLMDYAAPHWFLTMGQIASWASGFPVVLVTVYGALVTIHRSNMRWSMPPRLLLLSLFGWVAGGFVAVIDSTIRVNLMMHNTQWVPGHFHFYLLIGSLAMVLALMYHVIGQRAGTPPDSAADRVSFPVYVAGALIFLYAFLDAGRLSVPRRIYPHIEAWMGTDRIGSIGAVLVVAAMIYFAIRITIGLLRRPPAAVREGVAHPAG